MTVTAVSFRKDFPEFTDPPYTALKIQFWANLAGLLLRQERWGPSAATENSPPTTIYDQGIELFVAHNLVLERARDRAADKGAIPGLSKGMISSEGVGPVSVSYDTGSAMEEGAGHWNLTTYGLQFIQISRYLGSAGYQGNIGCSPYGPLGNSPWLGPDPWPRPGGSGFG